MKTNFRSCVSALVLCSVVGFGSPALAQGGMAGRVEVRGAERVDPATVLSYMTIKPGEVYSQENLSDSAKALYATGLFADVNIVPEGGKLVVKVVENPLINQVAFEGNDKLKDTDLSVEVASRARNVLARNTVRADVERIQNLYRRMGRYSVQVEPKIIRLDQNRVNLVFEINEGPLTHITGIKFVGNSEFSDNALRDVIASKEERWYRFLSNADSYDQDRLAYDQELLRRYYLKEGYVDFRVVSSIASLSTDKESFYLTFTVEEGERYKVASVSVDTSAFKDVAQEVLEADLEIEQGDWYNADDVEESLNAMTDTLGDMQYAFASVRPDVSRNVADRSVDIVFRAVPTPKVYVERIDIKGNVRTQDKVVRREFDLAEGDAFNKTKIARAEQAIKDLNFFDNVQVRPVPGSTPDQTIVNVDVQEKSTGEISIGAGFSTSDGPLADFQIRERNFLGRGQDLSFSTAISGKTSEFDVSFTEPYFLDRDLSAGVDAFHTTTDYQDESSYDQKRTGGALRVGYPLGSHLRQALKYRLENNKITDVDDDASRYIRDQKGSRLTSAIAQYLTYDRRDSMTFPTKGYNAWLNAEFAGLGGDAQYVSTKVGGNYYYPVSKGVVLNTLLEGGAIRGWGDEDVRINERYFLGGNTLRGFESSGVGPRDTSTDDALGGNLFYRGSVEMTFPLGVSEELGLSGHAFSDFGSLWSVDETGNSVVDKSSLRAAGGVGVSWRSPMGPIRLDLATPFLKEDYDQKEEFRFSFGTRF